MGDCSPPDKKLEGRPSNNHKLKNETDKKTDAKGLHLGGTPRGDCDYCRPCGTGDTRDSESQEECRQSEDH